MAGRPVAVRPCGARRTRALISLVIGPLDFLAHFSVNHADGYRFSPAVETRFYVGVYVVDQLLSGTLSLSDASNNPTKAAPGAVSASDSAALRVFT
ncbi:hypothetical protein [Burkholderia ubonensis]|uniref:hypothetical protein n=1 Tax=Burkholderia ubonensis TaxID=101571 RepID=UPI0039F5F1B0